MVLDHGPTPFLQRLPNRAAPHGCEVRLDLRPVGPDDADSYGEDAGAEADRLALGSTDNNVAQAETFRVLLASDCQLIAVELQPRGRTRRVPAPALCDA